MVNLRLVHLAGDLAQDLAAPNYQTHSNDNDRKQSMLSPPWSCSLHTKLGLTSPSSVFLIWLLATQIVVHNANPLTLFSPCMLFITKVTH